MRLSPIFFACMHLIVGVPQPGHNSPNLPGTFKPPTTGPGTKNPGTTPGNNNPGTIPGQHSVKPGNIDKQPSDTTNKKHTCKHIHGSLTRPNSTPDNTSQTASCKDNFGSLATGYAKGYDWGKFFFIGTMHCATYRKYYTWNDFWSLKGSSGCDDKLCHKSQCTGRCTVIIWYFTSEICPLFMLGWF